MAVSRGAWHAAWREGLDAVWSGADGVCEIAVAAEAETLGRVKAYLLLGMILVAAWRGWRERYGEACGKGRRVDAGGLERGEENLEAKKKRTGEIIRRLEALYPGCPLCGESSECV